MRKGGLIVLLLLLVYLSGCIPAKSPTDSADTMQGESIVTDLPEPRSKGEISLEEALANRRSIREYTEIPLSQTDISQLLWAAQGITAEWGGRTSPSAGGTYPIEVYLSAGNMDDLAPGVYKYRPEEHAITKVKNGDVRAELSGAVLDQTWVKDGAIDIIIAADYQRTTAKYGDRGLRYVQMEVGHVAQNICLQATVLGLGAVTVGAFSDERVKSVLGMPKNESPLYVIPVGYPED